VSRPLHPNQHAYQSGKSVETALHQLVVRVEKALDQQEGFQQHLFRYHVYGISQTRCGAYHYKMG
jgi:hypothetical protein